MSSFEPNKRHLRELLIYFLNLEKYAAETHRLLVETYGEAALTVVGEKIAKNCTFKKSKKKSKKIV